MKFSPGNSQDQSILMVIDDVVKQMKATNSHLGCPKNAEHDGKR
jgi:hypothetical protein